MREFTFTPRIHQIDFLSSRSPNLFDAQHIKNEPMLFNCDYQHARLIGGPITRALLDALPPSWKSVPLVIDTKSAMLMPGWYPCIPGWHHDDVERRGPYNQPDYMGKDKRAEFVMVLVGSTYSSTEFLMDPISLVLPQLHKKVYEDWDRQINFQLLEERVSTRKAFDREVIFFDDNSFHRGSICGLGGWRYFGRVSRYYDKNNLPIARGNLRTNEIRNQVQIYMDKANAGW